MFVLFQCVNSAGLLSGCSSDDADAKEAIARMVIAMYRGSCFLPEPGYFVDELFEYYGASNFLNIESKKHN